MLAWGRIVLFGRPKSCVPQRHSENSPAFERRGLTFIIVIKSCRDDRKQRFISAVPAGLDFSKPFPGIEAGLFSIVPSEQNACSKPSGRRGAASLLK
jgi:hypothetical protein